MEIPTIPQLLQDVKRNIELNYERFINKTIKLETQDVRFPSFDYTAYIDNNWKIKWSIMPTIHNNNCSEYDDSGFVVEDNTIIGKCAECNNEQGYNVSIFIYYNKILIKNLGQNTMLDGNQLTWNDLDLEHKLSFLEKPIIMCECGKRAKNDDKCKECHLFSYTRTEEEGGDCAVCLENGGVWHKLECTHVMHKICLKKISKPICPLCRAKYKYPLDIPNNPYKKLKPDSQ